MKSCGPLGLLGVLWQQVQGLKNKLYWVLIVIYTGFRAKVDIHKKFYVVEIFSLCNLRKEESFLP